MVGFGVGAYGSGFWVWGLGTIQGLGFKVQSSGFRA